MSTRVLIKPTNPAGDGIWLDLIDEDDPQEGSGAWADVQRPRRKTAVQWTGEPAATYVLPLMLDGIDTPRRGHDSSVEHDVRRLRALRRKSDKTGEPPIVRIAGPLHFPDTVRWVVDGLTWGAKQRNKDGQRIQQLVTVTLKEYVSPTVVKSPAKRHREHHKK